MTSRLHELHGSKVPFVSVSNLSVLNFRIFLLMYPGSLKSLGELLLLLLLLQTAISVAGLS